MAMDLELCLYVVNGSSAKSNQKAKATNETPKVVYDNFLQGISNDIQRYQALQRVACGHQACKDALLKGMQTSKKG